MEEIIGETAGKVWQILKKKGEVNLAELPRLLQEKSLVVYQAVGWLARENKILYQKKGSKTVISLAEAEKRVQD